MNTFIAWMLVALSFVVLAAFPFFAVLASGITSISVQGRVAIAVVMGFLVAIAVNAVAGSFFSAVELERMAAGQIREEDLEPDMPNLLTGLLVFGWIAVVFGNVLGQAVWRRRREQGLKEISRPLRSRQEDDETGKR